MSVTSHTVQCGVDCCLLLLCCVDFTARFPRLLLHTFGIMAGFCTDAPPPAPTDLTTAFDSKAEFKIDNAPVTNAAAAAAAMKDRDSKVAAALPLMSFKEHYQSISERRRQQLYRKVTERSRGWWPRFE